MRIGILRIMQLMVIGSAAMITLAMTLLLSLNISGNLMPAFEAEAFGLVGTDIIATGEAFLMFAAAIVVIPVGVALAIFLGGGRARSRARPQQRRRRE